MKTYVFTNRVYPPVGGATGELLKELAEGLAGDGARVVVVTSRAEEDKRPRDKETKGLEVVNGVEVIRVGAARFTRASHWRRAWSYLTLYPQLMWQVWKLGKVDAVVSMTDPPLQVAAVALASCRAKKKIHWAQDVYPELAEELGVIPREGLVARVLRSISTWALRRQDEVVAVGRCMRERLVKRGVDAGKIEVIPNWSPVGAVSAASVAAMRKKLGWDGKFIALYSGNIGLAHDFETLVGAAKLLEGGGVQVVFAGEGPRLEQVRRETEGLAHVAFLPPQAREDLSAFLAAADVHLVSVRAGLEGLVVPSKAYGIFAVGRPIFYVGGADSEVAGVIAESGCGVVIPNRDAAGLAEAIKQAARQGEQRVSPTSGGFKDALAKWRELLAG
jgi:glycosyltransferase involved in cell wall biosynthesis